MITIRNVCMIHDYDSWSNNLSAYNSPVAIFARSSSKVRLERIWLWLLAMAVEMAALPAADALDEGDIIGIVQVAPQAGDETIVCATCVLQKPKESSIELNKGKDCTQTFRCRDCHRCMGRMQFVKQHKGVGDFGVVGKQKKIEWFQEKHALIGDDLAASMQDTIKLTISEKKFGRV